MPFGVTEHGGRKVKIKRKLTTAVVAVVTALASLTGFAAPAGAAYTDCSSGRACLWTGYSYPGTPNASFLSSVILSGSNNQISSIVNNGNSSVARFYDAGNHSGVYIALNNPARGGQTRDPDLSNGINATSENWDNRISSAKFV